MGGGLASALAAILIRKESAVDRRSSAKKYSLGPYGLDLNQRQVMILGGLATSPGGWDEMRFRRNPRVYNTLRFLERFHLAERSEGKWMLTDRGEEAVAKLSGQA